MEFQFEIILINEKYVEKVESELAKIKEPHELQKIHQLWDGWRIKLNYNVQSDDPAVFFQIGAIVTNIYHKMNEEEEYGKN